MAKDVIYTLEQFIDSGVDDIITYHNLSLIDKIGNIEYPTTNLLYDYIKELKSISQLVTMTDLEYIKYIYKPKLLANDVSGSSELYFVILALNNMCNIKEFTLRKIYLLSKSNMNEILNYIYNAEKDFIQKNRSKIQ
jgi:hypothetical protein